MRRREIALPLSASTSESWLSIREVSPTGSNWTNCALAKTGAGTRARADSHARVLMSDSHRSPVFDMSRFTSVGVTVGLLVLGGLVAMQFRPHTNASSSSTPFSAPANTSLTVDGPNGKTLVTGTMTGDSAKPLADMTGKTQAGVTPFPFIGPLASATPPIQNPVNPTVIYQTSPQQIRYVTLPASNVLRSANGAAASGKRARAVGNAGSTGGSDDSRVVLPGDSDVVEGNGKITVKVGENDVPGKLSDKSAIKNGDKGSDANPPDYIAHVEAEKSRSNGAKAAPSAATGDARSLMVVGEERKRGKDFRGAIDAFTRALANAGDQTGYAYQQRALCYQNLSDASSAKADYERAIGRVSQTGNARPRNLPQRHSRLSGRHQDVRQLSKQLINFLTL